MNETFEPSGDAQLIDAVAEAVVTPPTREARAAVLNELVQEINKVVKWRYTEEADEEEVRSLGTVVAAASQHLKRMHLTNQGSEGPVSERTRSNRPADPSEVRSAADRAAQERAKMPSSSPLL